MRFFRFWLWWSIGFGLFSAAAGVFSVIYHQTAAVVFDAACILIHIWAIRYWRRQMADYLAAGEIA